MGADSAGVENRRAYQGLDRGFIFFRQEKGIPWKGLTSLTSSEDDSVTDTYYMDGRKIGQRFKKGNYHAEVTSFDYPFRDEDQMYDVIGFSYRERFTNGTKENYRLHIIHGAEINYKSGVHETFNVEDPKGLTTFTWTVDSLDVLLREYPSVYGSHLILDTSELYPWSVRDIENILYDEGRIPSIDEMMNIFSEMNLIIIDHGDGTWSAVGHESMVKMLDATEFMIESPSIEFDDQDPRTYDIEDYIRDERWLG